MHTHVLKTQGVPLPDVHTTVLGFPLSQSLHLCHTCFTGSALRYPIFSLSSDSPSLAVPPGGCSAQKFVLSWIFTIALQFTFTKINSPTWKFCNQHRDPEQTNRKSGPSAYFQPCKLLTWSWWKKWPPSQPRALRWCSSPAQPALPCLSDLMQ